MTTRLDVSIGPVQGFVSQSRRTRDLWGSSYLLSFLSAHAMHGAEEAGGKIVRPLVEEDELYQWVKGRRSGDPPRIGSVPNHFVAEVDEGEDVSVVARRAEEALMEAWRKVHEAVWCKFVVPVEASGLDTRGIWDRQVRGFWEIAWTAAPRSDDPAQKGLLARRKHWRDHWPPDEPGDKCTVMHDLQELSGYVRSEGTQSRENQDRFWSDLRKHVGTLNIRENERLCAVALTKRLFPKIPEETLGWNIDSSHWPSTVHIAAAPWIERVGAAAPGLVRSYADAVKDHAPKGAFAEGRSPLLKAVAAEARDFARLDANWFHRESVENAGRCPLRDEYSNDDRSKAVRDKLTQMLREIANATDEKSRPLGPPAKYYALVLADGDRLGKLVSELGGPKVGRALAEFTGKVQSIVEKRAGVTVYAGGDDVMAMLPLPTAIQCADALSSRYQQAFAGIDGAKSRATLSAAVVFAHVRFPLSSVIGQAHRLLDNVAKDGNGRDSLAVGVLKPGGMYCQWATTWTRRGQVRAHEGLDKLAQHLREADGDPGLSSSLIYRARKTLTMLCGWDRWEPGDWGRAPIGFDVVKDFLRAEVARSLDIREGNGTSQQANAITELVCDLLGRSHADEATGGGEIGMDALLLARFLAGDGHEDEAR